MLRRETKRAAVVATLFALPAALIAGYGVYSLGDSGAETGASSVPQPTTAVSVSAEALSAEQADACRTLVLRLPPAVLGLGRRPVSPGSPESAAAYGEPPIVVVCGGPEANVSQDEQVWILSGTCWTTQRARQSNVWSTVDRMTPVRVTVPDSYSGQAQYIQDLTEPIRTLLPTRTNIPSACLGR